MVNRKKSLIKFRQSLISAVNDVVVASLKEERLRDQNECDALPDAFTGQAVMNARDIFKTKLQRFFQVIAVPGSVLTGGGDFNPINNVQREATTDLCKSVDELWRSSID